MPLVASRVSSLLQPCPVGPRVSVSPLESLRYEVISAVPLQLCLMLLVDVSSRFSTFVVLGPEWSLRAEQTRGLDLILAKPASQAVHQGRLDC